MSLRYCETNEVSSISYVVEKARDLFSEEYSVDVDMLLQVQGALVGIYVMYTKYVVEGNDVRIFLKEGEFLLYKPQVDALFFSYVKGMSYRDFFCRQENSIYVMGTYSFEKAKNKERKFEHGQAKILMSTLEPLINSGPEVHLLVLGSSSEETFNAGLSYEALVDYLSIAGYHGSMLLLDPNEVPRVFRKGGFVIETRSEKYEYKKKLKNFYGGDFSHVYDDVWMPTYTRDPHPYVPFSKVDIVLKQGRSKFAYVVRDGIFLLRNGLEKHVEIEDGLGGGVMSVEGNYVTIAGTSNRLGPYNEDMVREALSGYSVIFRKNCYNRGRLTWDPQNNLFNLYEGAKISSKYYGEEKPKGAIVRDQIFYTGLEKRILVGVNPVLSHYIYGDGCKNCMEYGSLYGALKVHSEVHYEDWFNGLLTRVISDKCIKRRGVRFNRVMGLIMGAAHKELTYVDMVDAVTKSGKVCESVVHRAYTYLRNTKKVDLYKGAMPISRFTECDKRSIPYKWYIPGCYDHYLVRKGSKFKIFDLKGKDCTRQFLTGRLVYRPNSVDISYNTFVNRVIEKYGSCLNSIDGKENSKCRGTYTCGYGDKFHYSIYRGYTLGAIYYACGWSLISNVSSSEW